MTGDTIWEMMKKYVWRIVSRKSKEKPCINVSIETSIERNTFKKRCCKGRLEYIIWISSALQKHFLKKRGKKGEAWSIFILEQSIGWEEFEALLKQCKDRMGEETWQKERLRPKNTIGWPRAESTTGKVPPQIEEQILNWQESLIGCKPCDKVHRTQVA